MYVLPKVQAIISKHITPNWAIQAIIWSTLLLSGCGDEAPVSTGGGSGKYAPMGMINSLSLDSTYIYSFIASRSQRETFVVDASGTHEMSTSMSQQTIAWVDDGGSVSFSGASLPRIDTTSWTYGVNTLNNMSLSAVPQSFLVTASPNFVGDTLEATVLSPHTQVLVNSPDNGDSVNKSSGITVTWSSAPGSQQVALAILGVSNPSKTLFVMTNDDGTHTFSSTEASALTAGTYDVVLMRGNYSTGEAPDGKHWIAQAFTRHTVRVFVY